MFTSVTNGKKERFVDAGIPYEELDPEMIDMIDVLNFNLNLKTQFCCYGHTGRINNKTYVIFDKSVNDEEIYHLAEQIGKENLQVNFYKWVRHHPIMTNWKLQLGVGWKNGKSEAKKKYIDQVVEALRKCKPYKI